MRGLIENRGPLQRRPLRRSTWKRRGPVRLHAERLEDRLLMTDNNPVDAELPRFDMLPLQPVQPINDVGRSGHVIVAPFIVPDPPPATSFSKVEPFKPQTAFERWLIEEAKKQWGYLFGTATYYPGSYGWLPYFYLNNVVSFDSAELSTTAGGVASSFNRTSSTNVQVAGVDEADLVETDGKYLYILSGQTLVIVDAGSSNDLRVLSRLRLDMQPAGMYVSGNRLAIVSSTQYGTNWSSYSPPKTSVTVLDVTDRAAPKLVQKTEMDGELATSRVVGGQLRLVLNTQFDLPMPIARPVDLEPVCELSPEFKVEPLSLRRVGALAISTAGLVAEEYLGADAIDQLYCYPNGPRYIYEALDEYLTRIRDTLLETIGPRFRSVDVQGNVLVESSMFDADDVEHWDSSAGRYATLVAAFDLNSNEAGPVATASASSNYTTKVYATADSVYIFGQKDAVWEEDASIWSGGRWVNKLAIAKFSFDAETGGVELSAEGEIEGTLLNQFSADEHDGFLRVITSSNRDTICQELFVLQQVGSRLELVGRIERIAPGETLHSVRFVGDRGYLVTFRRVDPLFALDLSDPSNPKLMGELTIPGVSGYLQLLDETHLLGVGRGGDNNGLARGDVELAIFDVSNFLDPQLLHRFTIDGGWSITTPILTSSWSTVLNDHHALGYFPDDQILAIPIFNVAGGGSEQEGLMSLAPGQGGLQVFRIDVESGFSPLALIKHDAPIERSIQIRDRLFAISNDKISMHELVNPANQLAEVEIGDGENAEFVELEMLVRPEATRFESGLTIAAAPVDDSSDTPIDAASLVPGSLTTPVADLRADWALGNLEQFNKAWQTRAIASELASVASRVDGEVLLLLAVPYSNQDSPRGFVENESLVSSGFAEEETFEPILAPACDDALAAPY